jgi:hypothetical protein
MKAEPRESMRLAPLLLFAAALAARAIPEHL